MFRYKKNKKGGPTRSVGCFAPSWVSRPIVLGGQMNVTPKTYPRNQTALLINYFAVRPNLTFRSYFVSQIKIRALSGTSGLQNPDWPQQLSNVKSSPRVVILTGLLFCNGPLRWAFQKASLLDPLHIFGDPGEKNTHRWKSPFLFSINILRGSRRRLY